MSEMKGHKKEANKHISMSASVWQAMYYTNCLLFHISVGYSKFEGQSS